jgi:hypothetical protein
MYYTFLKKFSAFAIVALLIFFTVISILGIWNIIEVKNVLAKTMGSLLVLFISSAIILFLFTVVLKEKDNK